MRINEPATQVNDKAVASALRCLYIKKNTDHRNMLKSYPVVGFISCLFVCLLFLFKMGYYLFRICSWLSPIILRPLIKHLIINLIFVVVFMFYNTKVRIVYYIICCIA